MRARLLPPLLFVVLALAGCAFVPEEGGATQRLGGQIIFPGPTALPPSARAHVTVVPLLGTDPKPAAEGDFPARTGEAIPFELKFPAERVADRGEYLVFAQIIDHGRVWYSNVNAPLRLSFAAEPGEIILEMRPEAGR